jgi:FixJ family two-component response regulator
MMAPEPSQNKPEQKAYIVEDDLSVGQALCDLFDSMGVSARHFGSAEKFLDAWTDAMSGCLILDVRLPGISGMELQARMIERGCQLPIIVMTAHGDIPMVRKALKAGAVEFLTKPFQDEELLAAVKQAFEQDRASRQTREVTDAIRARVASLSERERQVIEMVTTGMTNREIAAKLFLSVVTVKLYRRLAMEKMQAASLADLVKMWEKI